MSAVASSSATIVTICLLSDWAHFSPKVQTPSPVQGCCCYSAVVAAVVFSCSETATGYGRQCCNSLVPVEEEKKQCKTQKQEVDRCNLYLLHQVSFVSYVVLSRLVKLFFILYWGKLVNGQTFWILIYACDLTCFSHEFREVLVNILHTWDMIIMKEN